MDFTEKKITGRQLDFAATTRLALTALLIGAGIHFSIAIVRGWRIAFWISGVSLFAILNAYILSRLGRPRAALLLALAAANTACVYSAYAQEGIDNIAITVIPVTVMFASLLLDRNLLLLITGLTAGSTIGMVFLRWAQGREPFSADELAELVIVVSTIGLAAVVGHAMSANVRNAMKQLAVSERISTENAQALSASELRWQLAMRGSNDGVWDWNATTDELYVSDRWKTMLGYSPEELEGSTRDWESLVHPDDLGRVEAEIAAHLGRRTEFYISEYRMRSKGGGYRWILARGRALYDETGRAIRMAGSHSDITHRKDAEARAEMASLAKSEFLANLSHEIRTPMNAILGMAELLHNVESEEERRQYTQDMTSCARALLELLTQLLDLSRIESGGLVLANKPFSIRETVESTAAMFSAVARQNSVQVSTAVEEDVPQTLVGDATRLRQILMNLLGNALKFTRGQPAGIRISLDKGSFEEGSVRIRASVWDRGPGIPSEALPKVFDPFYQADASETREHGGIGLGLAICKRLIEQMRGALWVESEEGKGSTFYFTAAFERCKIPEKQEDDEVQVAGRPPLRRSARILLVEDNAVNQRVAKRLLEKHSHHVRLAADGFEALQVVESEQFDLILMDLHMPRMNGFTAASEIRRFESTHGRRTPIWALTAAVSEADRERSLAAGMDGFLVKPLELKKLLSVIDSLEALDGLREPSHEPRR